MKIKANFSVVSDELWEFDVPDNWTPDEIDQAFMNGDIWECNGTLVDEWLGGQVLHDSGWEVTK